MKEFQYSATERKCAFLEENCSFRVYKLREEDCRETMIRRERLLYKTISLNSEIPLLLTESDDDFNNDLFLLSSQKMSITSLNIFSVESQNNSIRGVVNSFFYY